MHRVTPWPEHARLRAESERIRAEAVRARIAAVQAFCSIAVSEARWGAPQKSQESMRKVWRAIGVLKQHLAEPQHVPGEMAGELLQSLAGVEERAMRIQESLYGGLARPASERVVEGRRRSLKARDPQTS